MTTYRVDERREEVADYTDRKLKELRIHFAGEVEELERKFIGKLQVLEQRKYPQTWIILVTVLVGLALCLGMTIMAQNALRREFEELKEEIHMLKTKQGEQELRKETENKELKKDIHSLKTKQEQQEDQTEGTNLQVGLLMGQMDSLITVREGAAVLVSTVVIGVVIPVVLLYLFCRNTFLVSVPLRNGKLPMIEQ